MTIQLHKRTCQYSWKCCTWCPWPWAGRPGLCGDSPKPLCHCRAQQVHCLRCTGKSWSFPGGPRRGQWQLSGLLPHPTDRGFPGKRETTLSTTHWVPSLSFGKQSARGSSGFSECALVDRWRRIHCISLLRCVSSGEKWKSELQLQWVPELFLQSSFIQFCRKKPNQPFELPAVWYFCDSLSWVSTSQSGCAHTYSLFAHFWKVLENASSNNTDVYNATVHVDGEAQK